MSTWSVRLNFRRDPTLEDPTQAEWDRLFDMAGEFVGRTGSGPPVEFTSTITIEADDEEAAIEEALRHMRETLDAESIHGWSVTSDTAWSQEDEKPEAGAAEHEEVGEAAEDGYDPGPPPEDY